MPFPESKDPLIVILGPTAVGKTETSIYLAETFNAEIISADSRLFYRGMDIGTAKPTHDERARVPHHLIDVADPDQNWNLAMFQREAVKAISKVNLGGRIPILVGGTGQYIRAVTEEWIIPEVPPNPQLRQVLEKWSNKIGSEGLYDRLTLLDPAAADRIDPRNQRRTIRALEVIFLTGKQFSSQKSRGPSRFRLLQIGLIRPRKELYARIDSRIDNMFEAGFVEEVRGLLDAGFSPDSPAFSAIGYRQVIDYLMGKIDIEEAIMLIKRITRKFVRRQSNWFKLDDPKIKWFQVEACAVPEIEITIREFLDTQ